MGLTLQCMDPVLMPVLILQQCMQGGHPITTVTLHRTTRGLTSMDQDFTDFLWEEITLQISYEPVDKFTQGIGYSSFLLSNSLKCLVSGDGPSFKSCQFLLSLY